jgi:hypothetical protein
MTPRFCTDRYRRRLSGVNTVDKIRCSLAEEAHVPEEARHGREEADPVFRPA